MRVKRLIRRALNSAGYDAHRFNAGESSRAQLARLLAAQCVDLVIDVGANAGQYARQLRFLDYRGDILSFEPMLEAHTMLHRACVSDSRWQAAPRLCIGETEGQVTLQVSANGESNSVLDVLPASVDVAPESRCIRREEVPMTTLDSYFRANPVRPGAVTLLKLDVQGYEHRVLAGAREVLAWCHGVQCELSLIPLYRKQPPLIEMLKMFRDLGFELHAMLPGFTDERTGRSLQMDGIFFRTVECPAAAGQSARVESAP